MEQKKPGFYPGLNYMAKYYFEVLREVVSHSKIEELSIPSALVNHNKAFYFTINIFSNSIGMAFLKIPLNNGFVPFN